jgi:predicted Zn finger-like uncharacterized protein
MALATTCPQCKTSFKVVPDQLKLRRGLVRCGMCQHVFSGIDYISQVLPAATTSKNASIPKSTPASADTDTDNEENLNTAFFIPDTVLAPTTQMMTEAFESRVNRESTALLRSGAPKSALFDQSDEQELSAVNFFSGDEQRKGMKGFANRNELFLAVAGIALVSLLLLQLLVGARHSMAAHFPSLSPAIEAISSLAGLKVETPRALDRLTIESFEFQASNTPDIYSLSAILRNGASHVVHWPAIELSLTDTAGSVLLRKVLLPGEYLKTMLPALGNVDLGQAEKMGLKPIGELPIKLALEITDINPSGFSAAIFYP